MTDAVEVTTAGGDDAELAADALWQAGAVAVEERSQPGGTLLVAAASGSDASALVAAAAGRWPATVVSLDPDADLDAWRGHAVAVRVGRVVVRPPWAPVPAQVTPAGAAPGAGPGTGHGVDVGAPVEADLVVDPGRAFGTGSHPSTRLSLGAVGELVRGGEQVLDVGCGSGVLAVAALVLGAAGATAVDVDPSARAATVANARRNGVADRLVVGEVLAPPGAGGGDVAVPGGPRIGPRPPERADLVVANMLAPVLVEVAPAVQARLAPAGTLVLAGLLATQRPAVLAAYPDLVAVGERVEGEWLCLRLRQRPETCSPATAASAGSGP